MHTAIKATLAAAVLFAAGAAQASQANVFSPNYMFPDGALGFALQSHGGPVNPGVLVGFNPQPDPPGFGDDGALIGLLNRAMPELYSPSTGGAFTFTLSLIGMADGSVIPLPAAPENGHTTGYQGMIGGHEVDIALGFGPGPVDPASWVAFNPQPDPPGDFLGGAFQFQGNVDPIMTFGVTIDGRALDFTLAPNVPEPATWSLLLAGFLGLGAMLRARRRPAPAAGA